MGDSVTFTVTFYDFLCQNSGSFASSWIMLFVGSYSRHVSQAYRQVNFFRLLKSEFDSQATALFHFENALFLRSL